MAALSVESFIVGALCVWRVTHLLNAEDGPLDWFVRLRRMMGDGFLGDVLDCFYCLSLWIAAPVALLISFGWLERPLVWLALSGAACLLERATEKPRPFPGIVYEQPHEVTDVLRPFKTTDLERTQSE
jgi:hypothetical protein